MKMRAFALTTLALSLLLTACEADNPITTGTSPATPLETQLEEAGRLNQQSARNSLQQAQNLYFQLSAPLISVSTDVDAYRKLVAEMLPAMLSTANSLSGNAETGADATQLRADFQELYSDTMTQIVQGINVNLAIYQGQIEASQTLDGSTGAVSSERALSELTELFQASEYAERFSAQLAQFPSLLSNAATVHNGIRNQQSVVINGILKLSDKIENRSALEAAYQVMVQTLTRPELLSQVARLAQRVYGDGQVALRRSELTPVQPNPNEIQMVVREASNRYRLVRINNGALVNEVTTDTRGLSASDLLFQSNVVVVTSPQPTTP